MAIPAVALGLGHFKVSYVGFQALLGNMLIAELWEFSPVNRHALTFDLGAPSIDLLHRSP